MMMAERIPIPCDCCGKQVMGYRVGDEVVWFNEHHGKRHTVKIPLDKSKESVKNVACTTE